MNTTIDKTLKKRGRKPKSIGEENKNITIKTYHFNMCNDMICQIDYFATLHKHDERKIFKEEWNKWVQTEPVAQLIASETERLQKQGFHGNVVQKLFNSARYYYRKKPVQHENLDSNKDTNTEETKKRKKYETMEKEMLDKIDQFILEKIREHIIDVKKIDNKIVTLCDISPANAYKEFIETIETEDNEPKIKKTFKNRFFVIRKKCEVNNKIE